MTEFKETLQHHLNQTRAGLYGQFEHALNFNTGPDQDALMKIAPGQEMEFCGVLTGSEQPCCLIVRNLLTGPSGQGFHGQTDDPGSRTIIVGADPATGQAELEFSCPTSGGNGGGIVSYCVGGRSGGSSFARYEAIDDTDAVIFRAGNTRNFTARDISHSPEGDWYTSGDYVGSPFFGDVGKFDSNGDPDWRGRNDAGRSRLVAHDSLNDKLGALGSAGVDTVLVIYEGAGPDQGGFGEPAPLFTVVVAGGRAFNEFDVVSDNNGFFYVATRSTDTYQGATPTVFRSIFKIDSATGVIVDSYNTARVTGGFTPIIRLAVGPAGEIVACQEFAFPGGPDGVGPDANVFRLDSSLSFVASDNIDWATLAGNRQRFVFPTLNAAGEIYIVSGDSYGIRYDNLLVSRQFSKFLITSPVPSGGSDNITNIGHNQSGKLMLFAAGQPFGFRAIIVRFDNDGVELASTPVDANGNTPGRFRPGGLFNSPPSSSFSLLGSHVLPQTVAPLAGPDMGSLFTMESSSKPPGRIQAICAVKYVARDIVGVYFNSVDVDFDHASWTATHSVEGSAEIAHAGDWEYNSPL